MHEKRYELKDGVLVPLNDVDVVSGKEWRFAFPFPVYACLREPESFRFITDGSMHVEIPATCSFRESCSSSILVSLSSLLGEHVSSLNGFEVVSGWSDDILPLVSRHVILLDRTEGKVLEYGIDWELSLAASDSSGRTFDQIVFHHITKGHEMELLWNLWPDALDGQGTQEVSGYLSPVALPTSITFFSVDGEYSIEQRVDPPLFSREIMSRETTWSSWVLERYPKFVKMMEVWLDHLQTERFSRVRRFADEFDVDLARDDVLSAISESLVGKEFSPSPFLLKDSSGFLSAKGSPDYIWTVSRLLGMSLEEIDYPGDRVLRTGERRLADRFVVRVAKLDDLESSGYGGFVKRLPSDPPPGTLIPDFSGELFEVSGEDSEARATVRFLGWSVGDDGLRVATFETENVEGQFEPWERLGGLGVPCFIVPVASSVRVVDGGSGYVVGDRVSLSSSFGSVRGFVSQTDDRGSVISVDVLGDVIGLKDVSISIESIRGSGCSLVLSPSVFSLEDAGSSPEASRTNHAVFQAHDRWHPFSYDLLCETQTSVWERKFRKVANPAGHQMVSTLDLGSLMSSEFSDDVFQDVDKPVVLGKSYWPKKPVVIAEGTEVDVPVIERRDDGTEVLHGVSGSVVVDGEKPSVGWGVSHGLSFVNGFSRTMVSRASEGFLVDGGFIDKAPANVPVISPLGTEYLIGNENNLVPHDIRRWTSEPTTSIDDVVIETVSSFSFPRLSGEVLVGVRIPASEHDIVVVHDKRVEISLGDTKWTSDENGVVRVVSGSTQVVSEEVLDDPVSPFMKTMIRVIGSDQELPLVVSGDVVIPYVAVMNGSGFPVQNQQPSVSRVFPITARDNVSIRLLFRSLGDATILRFPHVFRDITVSVDGSLLKVDTPNGLGEASLQEINDLYVFIGNNQRFLVVLNGKQVVSYENMQMPTGVLVGGPLVVLDYGICVDGEPEENRRIERWIV